MAAFQIFDVPDQRVLQQRVDDHGYPDCGGDQQSPRTTRTHRVRLHSSLGVQTPKEKLSGMLRHSLSFFATPLQFC